MGMLINPYRFVSGGAPAAWAPSDIGTLSSWYDPSDAANRTLAGSAYSGLTNKQGTAGRNLAQATVANQPLLGTAAINGRDAMDFDGANDWIGHAAPVLYTAGSCTVAAVFRAVGQSDKHVIGEATSGSSAIYSIFRTQNVNSNGAPDAYIQRSGALVDFGGFGDGTVTLMESPVDNHLLVVADSGSAITNWVDGVQSYTHTYTRVAETQTAFTLGCLRFSGGTFGFFDGFMGEVVCCTGVLATLDRQKLEGYLAHKWGASDELDAGHPYKASAP